ncbi:MAG: hypothetical protein HY916_09180 [Desulfovibrio sp.]|jgi:hypothetical protein|nr:hypothetical protein [Desulfovibrio sp.]
MNLSRLKMPRPGQLLALCCLALLMGLLVFFFMPNGAELISVAAWKAWLLSCYAALGMVVDLVAFPYGRPGAYRDHADRTIWLWCMFRRAIVIGSHVLAGAVAL